MVRLSSKEHEDKQQKRNRTIMGIFITIIMIGSTLGFFVGSNNTDSNNIEYTSNDGTIYGFTFNGQQYTTKINEEKLLFYSLPFDLARYNVSNEIKDIIKSRNAFYFTFDPDSEDIQYIEQARFELVTEMSKKNKFIIPSVIKNNSQYSYEIITCDNATLDMPVINFVESNTTKVTLENFCIIFQGKRLDFIRYRDLIVYTLSGVI